MKGGNPADEQVRHSQHAMEEAGAVERNGVEPAAPQQAGQMGCGEMLVPAFGRRDVADQAVGVAEVPRVVFRLRMRPAVVPAVQPGKPKFEIAHIQEREHMPTGNGDDQHAIVRQDAVQLVQQPFLLADVFEQLGYQQENPGLRNSYLAGAYELRGGIPAGAAINSSSPDVIRAMSTELFLNFLGIRMDSRKAEGMRFTMNLVTPDNGEKFIVELENATLTNIKGFQASKPDMTLTINRSDLEQTMMGVKTLESQIQDGTAKLQGNASILQRLASTMVDFDPRFEIMPGTKARGAPVEHADPYEAVPRQSIAE